MDKDYQKVLFEFNARSSYINETMQQMVLEELKNKEEDKFVVVERILTILKKNYPNTDNFSGYLIRGEFVKSFSWVIPNIDFIIAIILFANEEEILSIASGTCLIEAFIEYLGGKIISTDPKISHFDSDSILFHKNFQKLNAVDAVKQNSTNVLFICWPSYCDKYAFDALKEFKGNKLIYIGENSNGCNADQNFFDLLDEEWGLINQIEIECWYTIHDRMEFYERKIKP